MSIAHAEGALLRVGGAYARFRLAIYYSIYLLAILGIPILFSMIYLGTPDLLSLPSAERSHVLLNWLCILGVVYASARFGGSFEWHLPRIVAFAMVTHGGLAIAILAGRLYFSRPVLFTSFLVSIAFGLVIAWLESYRRPLKLAIIDPDSAGEANLWLDTRIERISDPERDLTDYDLVLVNFSTKLSGEWTQTIARAMVTGCRIRHIAEYVEKVRGRVSIDHFMHDQSKARKARTYQYGKRILDVFVVIVLLPVALPVVLFGMGLVFISMGSPIFFKQLRVGLCQKPFTMWKLRTMRAGPAIGAQVATQENDPRITQAGHFLRRYRIDELPQLWNVLKGDMSLIGPRPEQPGLSEFYNREIPVFSYRCVVRPGITGWAQVSSGYAANLGESRSKLTYDLYYVKNISLALDLHIALRTVWTLICGGGVR
jgi:lipopolysaccharide/colanic/teichoic acid biosynthesis glycosyltransferase